MTMRITGGTLCGRRIVTPRNGLIRPTQDRIREALFSMLGARNNGSRFLDLFAGSGAVGLEAWSRGADSVWWVEMSRRVCSVLRENVSSLCTADPPSGKAFSQKARVLNTNAVGFMKKRPSDASFDIIYADPPYGRNAAAVRQGKLKRKTTENWMQKILMLLAASEMLATDGLLIIEQAADQEWTAHRGWMLIHNKVYGDSRLMFFQQ